MSRVNQSDKQKCQIRQSDSSLHQFERFAEDEKQDKFNIYTDFFPLKSQYGIFQARFSILDEYHKDSHLRRSIFFGCYQSAFMISIWFLICYPIIRYFETGFFMGVYLFEKIKKDFFQALGIWPILLIHVHLAYILQIAIQKGLPNWLEILFQHFSQSLVLLYAIFITAISETWYPTNRGFVALMSFVYFMKMHSYTVENRLQRQINLRKCNQEQLQLNTNKNKNDNISETTAQTLQLNISYKKFLKFLFMPTFIYKENYPVSKSIDIKFIAQKSFKVFMCLIGLYIIIGDMFEPILHKSDTLGFVELMLEIMPFCLHATMIVFYLFMENLLNIFAEITKFSDRQFYLDWWNSTNYVDFLFKFCRPLHDFTMTYIFSYAKDEKKSDFYALMITSTITGLGLEFILALSLRQLNYFVLIFMFGAIPIYNIFTYQRDKNVGNIIFWIFFLLTIPFIITCRVKFQDPVEFIIQYWTK